MIQDFNFTATVTGHVGSDTVSYTLTRIAGEGHGTYEIKAPGYASQGNCSVTYENGTFAITEPAPAEHMDWYFWIWTIPVSLFILHMLRHLYAEMKEG